MTLFPPDQRPLAALSLWQPWASLMADGHKTIETRPLWAKRMRHLVGRDLAICSTAHGDWPSDLGRAAAKATDLVPRDLWLVMHDRLGIEHPLNWTVTRPRGSVLAVVRVDAVLLMVDATVPIVQHPADYLAVCPSILVVGHHDDARSAEQRSIEPERPFGDYAPGRVGILTDNLRRLEEPVPCSGRQQVWTLPADVEAAVREQVAA